MFYDPSFWTLHVEIVCKGYHLSKHERHACGCSFTTCIVWLLNLGILGFLISFFKVFQGKHNVLIPTIAAVELYRHVLYVKLRHSLTYAIVSPRYKATFLADSFVFCFLIKWLKNWDNIWRSLAASAAVAVCLINNIYWWIINALQHVFSDKLPCFPDISV